MGSFPGHALPGSFFITFALYFTVRTFIDYYRSQRTRRKFTSSIMADCSCCCGFLKKLPLEGFLKLALVLIGAVAEFSTGFRNGKFVDMRHGQHTTMYMAFGVASVIDILKFYKVPLPKDLDYLSYALAFTVEGILFKFHLHGRDDLNVLVHTLLLFAIGFCVLGVVIEMRHRHSIGAVCVRNFSILLQGTWFWQVGFILFNPSPGAKPWDPNDHDAIMLATMYFCWHCLGNCVLMLLIWLLVVLLCRKRAGFDYKNVAVSDSKSDNEESESDLKQTLVESDEY